MSWLGLLNWYVLQWFGIRLYKNVCEEWRPGDPVLWWGFMFVKPLSGYAGRPFQFWGPDRKLSDVRR